jgi:CBS domain-containing protein
MADFAQLRVANLMTIDPVAVAVDASIEEAESLLASYRISGLPVVDSAGRLVGVISKTNLIGDGSVALDALLRGNRTGLKVGELMTAPAITVRLDTTLVEAARIMTDAHIHRLVAVDERDRPIGVLSASDYVTLVAED